AGEVVTFSGFSGLLISRLDQISGFVSRTVSQAPTLRSFFELIEEGVLEDDSSAPAPSDNMASVTFENVTYRYAPKAPGVFDLNFEVKAGQSVALVGASGSGKTTTLGLLQRLYEPQQGRILIDGKDIREIPLPNLRASIAAVFQDAGLFNRSVFENIRVGKPSATLAEVEAAARRAEAHEFIMAKPNGYDYVVGERGLSLSGGERQRIAIARAILKDSPILILDEATSALDNETEKKIQLAIDHLMDTRTTFLIAHRLSTVVSADLILVFKDGRIIEAGTFEALRRKDGAFEALVKAGQLEPPKKPHVVTA
ncbi:MAG: ATP-binding cassette domain-containing protein, partial [Proteobacteria bacterium]